MKTVRQVVISVLGAHGLLFNTVWADEEQGKWSANAAYTSEYYYRGILQKESSASAGIDYEYGGADLGVWTADVGDGLEVDVFGGYTVALGELSLRGGFTGYYYTGEFDDTYQELNASLAWRGFRLEYSKGQYENFDKPSMDYGFLDIAYAFESGFYGRYGRFTDEFEGDFIELGYGVELNGFDVSVAAIVNSEELSDQADASGNPTSGEAIIFTLSKGFDW